MSDDSSLVSTSGFALRKNGSCLDTEKDCGATVGSFRACCPAGSFCPSQYNVNCCPSSANCTESLVKTPKCANETWDLYDNNGYFCCLQDTTGYSTPEDSDGCASPGYPFAEDETLLSKISAGKGMHINIWYVIPYVSLFYPNQGWPTGGRHCDRDLNIIRLDTNDHLNQISFVNSHILNFILAQLNFRWLYCRCCRGECCWIHYHRRSSLVYSPSSEAAHSWAVCPSIWRCQRVICTGARAGRTGSSDGAWNSFSRTRRWTQSVNLWAVLGTA